MSKIAKALKGLLAGLMAVSLVSVYSGGATVVNAEEPATETEWGDEWVKGNSLAIAKTADIAEDGTYDITLKSYSTGASSVIEKQVPVDIVLVLDVSGSMDDSPHLPVSYRARSSQSYTPRNIYNNNFFYKFTDGKYYKLHLLNDQYYYGYYYVYFRVGNTYYWLNGDGTISSDSATSVSADQTVFTGVLYEPASTITKLEGLQNAVNAFLDQIADKNKDISEEKNKNRVAIVKFAINRRYC